MKPFFPAPPAPDLHLLALDASTQNCSIAVQRAGARWHQTHAAGAHTGAHMLATIRGLMAQAGLGFGDLHAVVVGRGPGAFTGVRTACAVAQGLAFGAALPVLALDSLLAVAEDARRQAGCDDVLAVLDARMGEVYHARYHRADGVWHEEAAPALCAPDALPLPCATFSGMVAGNIWPLPGLEGSHMGPHIGAQPTAAALLDLAPARMDHALDAAHALPLYVRNKVAQTSAERAALRNTCRPA